MVNVGIYIYTDSIADLSNVFVDNFISRVQTDSGTFEAGNCLLSELQNLGGSLGVALQAKRIELFSDEKISVTSSIQNINDIGKTYTDFSQTFTVPATKNNNKIFKHWYENSNENGFSTLVKADAYIELDTIPFRSGKIQLESCDIKNGQPQSYSITFIGMLGSLKDKFGGKNLNLIDLSSSTLSYNGTLVKNRVQNTGTFNVRFPLISSDRLWAETGTTQNVTTTGGAISYLELFPAIKLNKIFDAIGAYSGVTFNGNFLSDARFTDAFLYLKNAEQFTLKTLPTVIDFTTTSGDITFATFNTTTDKATLSNYDAPVGNTYVSASIDLNMKFTVANIEFNILVYKNGILQNTFTKLTKTALTSYIIFSTTSPIGDFAGEYNYVITAEEPVSFTDANIKYNYIYKDDITSVLTTKILTATKPTAPTVTTNLNIDLSSYIPDIKIEDFFSGILKQFNLTCYSETANVYTINTIENYYSLGIIKDITKHIKSDSVNLNRSKTYKKINFDYEKSNCFLSQKYLSNNGVEYGNLKADLGTEGEDYVVKLPFENLLFSKFTSQDLQLGYCLDSNYQPYIPKPIILYNYGIVSSSFYINDGSADYLLTNYNAFGQDLLVSGINYSLNFGSDISSLLLYPIENSLYNQYYEDYLSNIFNYKARLIKVSAILPTSILTTLKLNDRLIIRDKRYIINSFTTDLTTGEASFELLTDLRTL